MKHNAEDILHHLHRIQGQISGVERMIAEKKNCSDVIMQIMAARSSLEKVALKLLEQEGDACAKQGAKDAARRLHSVASTLFKYT